MATKKDAKKTNGKAEKKAKEEKPKKEAAAKEPGERALHLAKKIKILSKDNPRREGSHGFKTFAIYKNGMTVAEALEKGAEAGYIHADANRGYISLS